MAMKEMQRILWNRMYPGIISIILREYLFHPILNDIKYQNFNNDTLKKP